MYKEAVKKTFPAHPVSNKLVTEQPPIVDVDVKVLQTSINNQVQSKLLKGGENEEISNDQNHNKVGGDRTPPNFLNAEAKYNFNGKIVALCFWCDGFDWKLESITGMYDFTRMPIANPEFFNVTNKDYVYNMRPRGAHIKSKVFTLCVKNIYRHVLMKQFTITLGFSFYHCPSQHFTTAYTLEVPYFRTATKLQFKYLAHYPADKAITNLYNAKFKLEPNLDDADKILLNQLDQHQKQELGGRDTIKMIKYALNIEDLSSQESLKEYALKNVRIEQTEIENENNGKRVTYAFPVEAFKVPPNYFEMSLCIVPMKLYKDDKMSFEGDCIFVQIDGYAHGQMTFHRKIKPKVQTLIGLLHKKPDPQEIDVKMAYCIRFVPNRITYRACFQALDMIKKNGLQSFFDDFQDEPKLCKKNNGEKVQNFEWFNPQIGTNEEQKAAIENIVNCTAFPFPYVVLGPPGTGKTSCIVECIAQILKVKPNSKILVTAQSNSACDEVGVRLLKHVSRNKIYRFYSPSLLNPNNGETSAVLRRTSNLRNNKNEYPTKEEFNHLRVMIVTLTTCSRLVQLDIETINRNFDYIFVDEAAAATEPDSLVPIMGLGTCLSEITANIILLGDHKQLGAVITSDIASRLGLGLSLLERIMSKRRYQRNPRDKAFDKNFVTQLLDNYRSHPAILQFSNVLFYESKLRAKVSEPEKSFALQWNYLSNNKFPILFHCVTTKSQIAKGGNSSFNEGEIKMVRFYVDLLLNVGVAGQKVEAKDIGIVSPYKAQQNKLIFELRHQKGVEIGSAEYYQGREKKIIIISTVKSGDKVGFLKSEKRLNVCITRAKSLLILIGNANTLQQNSLWNSFLHFCKANEACCGEAFTLSRLTDDEQEIQNQLNSILVNDSGKVAMTAEADTNQNEALTAMNDRMLKLEELMKKM